MTVVFDFGNVLSRPTAALPRLAALLGAGVEDFEGAYLAERPALDRGCVEPAYWAAVGDRLGVRVDEPLGRQLSEVDNAGWLDVDPAALGLVEELHERGVPVAVLSNAPASFGRLVEQQPWAGCFAQLVFSGDLRLAKPDPEIYRRLLDRLGEPAEQCTFFDDRQENVDAALQLGMRAHLWRGADRARAQLGRASG